MSSIGSTSLASGQLGRATWSTLSLIEPDPLSAGLEQHAGLTLAALGSDAAWWIESFLDCGPLAGSAHDGFLAFVVANTDDPLLRSLARFERALSIAREARSSEDHEPDEIIGARLCLHPAACVVELPGPADEIIGAIALGTSVPSYGRWPVLVAPGLRTLWRQATAVEDALCTWLTRPRETEQVRARFRGVDPVLRRLLAARAIVVP